ncbi:MULTISPECIES: hypothetical protein [Microbacterium]|nr:MULTISPECIES: hypothetical protein [Microbacterium]MDQ1082992.1 hypothetical protein [Microbacterium sp. SORGH_AS_0344]MDQ1168241.1 hypothetical protein [Microbacterium proteolyticum]
MILARTASASAGRRAQASIPAAWDVPTEPISIVIADALEASISA